MASSKKSSKAAAKPTATTIVGEDKAPLTTLALGEEYVVTTIVGEQAQPSEELSAAAEASGTAQATTVVGESRHPHLPITTLMVGEEHGGGGTSSRPWPSAKRAPRQPWLAKRTAAAPSPPRPASRAASSPPTPSGRGRRAAGRR